MGSPDYRMPPEALHGPGGPSFGSVRPMRKALLAAFGSALVALVATAQAGATLKSSLTNALQTSGVSWSATSAFVFDLQKSAPVYRHNIGVPLRPASNEKLTVAVTALDRLGADFRIPTRVFRIGSVDAQGVLHGRMILKGYGDPWLMGWRLARLAQKVRAAGIKKVTGRILGDESYFDSTRVCPGWKASFYKIESPPLSALVVNRAHVDNHMWNEPARAAAVLFKRALRTAGVAVPGTTGKGVAGSAAVEVAESASYELRKIVRRMDHVSDNFFAEMLLKGVGKRVRGSGTTAAGLRVVRSELRQRGVTMTGLRLADGSGLSLYDRLTTKAIGELLISAASDPAISVDFVDSLPVAGKSGTLEDRMERLPARGHVYAKTGTTDLASALSGYVTTRYVFSVLQNGNPVPYLSARRSQDRFAQILAGRAT